MGKKKSAEFFDTKKQGQPCYIMEGSLYLYRQEVGIYIKQFQLVN